MQKWIKVIAMVLFLILTGCTPGIFSKADSTAPSSQPVYAGVSRMDAEKRLGEPILIATTPEDDFYTISYEYEIPRGVKSILINDIADILTLGLWEFMATPIDRVKGTRHLIIVTYLKTDINGMDDPIIGVLDKANVNPWAIHYSQKCSMQMQRKEWESAIISASEAIFLAPELSIPYINRALANINLGRFNNAIEDCTMALKIDSGNSIAFNNRGLAYEKIGDIKNAVKDYESACETGLELGCTNFNKIKPKKS